MEVHSPVNYRSSTSLTDRYSRKSSSYYSKSINESDPVLLHPLIIGKDIVVCMPEVNRVLRNVYQVLSQANYYLSKHGISSRRYTGAQLIRIKMLGILGHEAKVCSYILQRDAEHIFDSFDVSGDSRRSTHIQWMDPVLLDEKPIPDPPRKSPENSNNAPVSDGPITVHLFQLGEDIIICAPDVQKVVQANFHQGATVGYYFTKLGIVPYKFIHTSHLDKIKELSIIKRSAVHCTYILKSDAMRVFEAYGMSESKIEENVKFNDIIELGDAPSRSWKPLSMGIKKENSPSMATDTSPKASCLSPNGLSDQSSRNSIPASDDDDEDRKNCLVSDDMTVNVFIVEKHEVVCMPDIHKIVQSIHGNSIQVNYYFNKLKVQKRRFCFAHLRELKSRNVLQNNATYCTHVPRTDAEKLFQIYCLVDDPKLKGIKWTDPINLDGKGANVVPSSDDNIESDPEKAVVIHTFSLDNNIVITVPDVHKMVDYLDEQSASLDYHFRKLGIIKHRFTYSQLHQLRRLNVIKRPTVCTFITRDDVDKLLNMYETERNKHKILSVKFLPPVALVPGTAPNKFKVEKSPSFDNSFDNSFEDTRQKETVGSSTFRQPSPVEPSPTFLKNQQHESDILSPNSVAITHIQNIHPTIDCPIVIPNGDYDPTKFGEDNERSSAGGVLNGKRSHETDHQVQGKRMKYGPDVTHQILISDINRKEDELRLLHDAYQREIEEEREKRITSEYKLMEINRNRSKDIEDLKSKLRLTEKEVLQVRDDLTAERKIRERLEREIILLKDARE